MTATQVDAIAELQRANAELRRERDAALAQRATEFSERIEHQTATIDVLKAMSSTPDDAQPAFDLIARRAAELCGSRVLLTEFDGSVEHARAISGYDAETRAGMFDLFPKRPDRSTVAGRAILERRVIHIPDVTADPNLAWLIQQHGGRSVLAIPLLRDEQPIGVIGLTGNPPGGYSDSQVALLQTFAEQAVIAITSAETYRALQTRTSDLQETLEYQTATSDVLKVISGSEFELEPVFQAVVETATRLCRADQAVIYRYHDGVYRWAAGTSLLPDYERIERGVSIPPGTGTVVGRVALEHRPIEILDALADPLYEVKDDARVGGIRTLLGVPLMRDGTSIGVIGLARQRVEAFTERQIELVKVFADQAVIAIENTRLITEQREALEQQTATAEVLQVINASLGDLAPVFDAMLEKATRLCDAAFGLMAMYNGEKYDVVATHGVGPDLITFLRAPPHPDPESALGRIEGGEDLILFDDLADTDLYQKGDLRLRALVDLGGAHSYAVVALRKDRRLLGIIAAYRGHVRPFEPNRVSLLQGFAAQAVIAMENARLITETREALERQTATAEVLQVLNASPGDLAPVFDVMLQKALTLCGAAFGQLVTFDGAMFRAAAWRGYEPGPSATAPLPGMALYQLVHGEQIVHIPDITADDVYRSGNPVRRRLADEYGGRSAIWVALRRDEELLGAFVIYRTEVRPFSDKQIALLQNFAAQAVVAMENTRLLSEVRQRQAELRITFENMGDGVAMFDETLRLVAWNRKFQEILNVPDEVITARLTYADYIRYLAGRGEYGPGTDPEAQLRHFQERTREHYMFERIRPDGRVIEVRHNPVPDGGFVLIYADITERKRNEGEIRAARDAAEEASRTIEAAYRELKTAQANLIQAEKMASLGQLTAGIAHEIKNPLNFVNNFSALSTELIDELRDVLAPEPLGETARTEVDDLTALLKGNLEKVVQHGQRADGIVKSMLDHSRGSSGERRTVDLNALIDEALNLAYHGARAQDQSFNITLERDFGAGIAPIEVNPQDMTRVLLNIFSNGFYAATRQARETGNAAFVPTLKVTTIDAGEAVEIRIRDNGTGIPPDIRDKLFQPFFTTKPTGEGTGLGLSITYDIVTQQHGGTIAVESEVGEYSEFTIRLPRKP